MYVVHDCTLAWNVHCPSLRLRVKEPSPGRTGQVSSCRNCGEWSGYIAYYIYIYTLYMYMYDTRIYMYIHMYIYIYIFIYIYIYIYRHILYMYFKTCIYVYTYIYVLCTDKWDAMGIKRVYNGYNYTDYKTGIQPTPGVAYSSPAMSWRLSTPTIGILECSFKRNKTRRNCG